MIVALLRDRYDDRYGSASDAEGLGVKEIARIPYAPEGTRRERDGMHAYSRLITLLTFANRGEPDAGRSVLLLPVDSRTLPRDSARRVATTLETSGKATGMVIGVWSDNTNVEAGPAYWDATVAGVQSLTEASDLALVPVVALDRAATGLGLAALADDTLLLVSESTPMQAVLTAIDDLRTVDVSDPQVVVVTGRTERAEPPRQRHAAAGNAATTDRDQLTRRAEPASLMVALAAEGLDGGRPGTGPLRHGPAGRARGGDAVGVRAPVRADRRAVPTDRRGLEGARRRITCWPGRRLRLPGRLLLAVPGVTVMLSSAVSSRSLTPLEPVITAGRLTMTRSPGATRTRAVRSLSCPVRSSPSSMFGLRVSTCRLRRRYHQRSSRSTSNRRPCWWRWHPATCRPAPLRHRRRR